MNGDLLVGFSHPSVMGGRKEQYSSEVQSVVFNKQQWTLGEAKYWLYNHGFKVYKVDEKEKSYRFRQTIPDYDHYITKKIHSGRKEIDLIIGFPEIV